MPVTTGRAVQQRAVAGVAHPSATFVPLDGSDHILLADEPAWPGFLHHVEAFTAEVDGQ